MFPRWHPERQEGALHEQREGAPVVSLPALVLVPGLAESPAHFRDLFRSLVVYLTLRAQRDEGGALPPPQLPLFLVATPTGEEEGHFRFPSEIAMTEWVHHVVREVEKKKDVAAPQVNPVVVAAQPAAAAAKEGERSLDLAQWRVRAVQEALIQARQQGVQECVVVGHSAGGFAALRGSLLTAQEWAREVSQSKEQKGAVPSLRILALAPATGREAGLLSVDPTCVRVLFGSIRAIRAYVAPIVRALAKRSDEHITIRNAEDHANLRTLLTEKPGRPWGSGTGEATEAYLKDLAASVSSIPAQEAAWLLTTPYLFADIDLPSVAPFVKEIVVVIPADDAWVRSQAQRKLARSLRMRFPGEVSVKSYEHVGGHIAPYVTGEPLQAIAASVLTQWFDGGRGKKE